MQARILIASTAAFLAFAPRAEAQETVSDTNTNMPGFQYSLKLEPGLAGALTSPQSNMTEAGLAQTVKLLFGVNRWIEAGPSATFTTLPASPSMTDAGTSWGFGGSARLMRPRDTTAGQGTLRAMSPWIDVDLMYVRTGGLDRPGFAAAAGVALPIDEQRRFWIGPFARYSQIVQGEREGFDNRDAKILTVGLGLEIGSGLGRKRELVVAVVEEPVAPVEPIVAAVSDRDGDGLADDSDNCPDVAGLAENAGCPPYERIVVKPDKLELKQNIAFEQDSAKLEEASYPLLDEVVVALQDNPGFKVQVDGHASSEGSDAHNQTLSEVRAQAVLDYLVVRGVAADRLVSKGFSSSQPHETNLTNAGRESNRRVEFVVSFIIVKEGNTP
jgi:outer membrane protein OmpA-like peptidoglycan-associated protein